ncbi:MAG: prolipoprotein diacylglyceryl transferase, partial [Pseudomonadota bacterium]
MFPDLFSIGPLTVHTYGLFVAIGFAVALLVTLKTGKTQAVAPKLVLDMAFFMILWAIIGSRLLYVLNHFAYYRTHPAEIVKIWQGGLVFSGGLVAVIGVMIWYLKRHHLSFWTVGDLWAPGVTVGQAVGRIGCFMAGCCYGRPTDLVWGVVFNHPQSLAPLHVPLHPTQLYATLSGFMIFVILLLLGARKRFEGQVFVWFLILHSTARLLIERFRGDERGMIPGSEMSVTQLVATIVLLGGVGALLMLKSGRQAKSRE